MKNLINKEEKDRIDLICNQYKITMYSIDPDGTIDVDGSVVFPRGSLTSLPLKFGKVSGDFYCSNNRLTSLKGSPTEVGGDFNCQSNKLTSLEGGPNSVGGDFNCQYNGIRSLHGSPHTISLEFNCSNNKLTSLEGSPNSVGGNYWCQYNNLTSLVGAPHTIGWNLICSYNNLSSTYSGDIDIETSGVSILSNTTLLPPALMNNMNCLKTIIKYQRHFEIWNDDLSLNVDNFNDLITEIKDGLE